MLHHRCSVVATVLSLLMACLPAAAVAAAAGRTASVANGAPCRSAPIALASVA